MKPAPERDGEGRSREGEMREGGGASAGSCERIGNGCGARGRGLIPCHPVDFEVCLGST